MKKPPEQPLGIDRVEQLLKAHPVDHLVNNINWNSFERILELTESTPKQFLEWLEGFQYDNPFPCLGNEYRGNYLFFSQLLDEDVETYLSCNERYIWVNQNFIGKGITIETTWDLYRKSVGFRQAVTKKYKEKYGL